MSGLRDRFHRKMAAGGWAGRSRSYLARLVVQCRKQLSEIGIGRGSCDTDNRDVGDGEKLVELAKTDLDVTHDAICSDQPVGGAEPGVAILLGIANGSGADGAGRTGLIDHDEALSQCLLHFDPDQSRYLIGGSARREWHDDGDGMIGLPFVGASGGRSNRTTKNKQKSEKVFHARLPRVSLERV